MYRNDGLGIQLGRWKQDIQQKFLWGHFREVDLKLVRIVTNGRLQYDLCLKFGLLPENQEDTRTFGNVTLQ
jgi:hypothetical protein